MIYDFTSNIVLNLLNIVNNSNFLYIKISIKNAIVFVNINIKYYYNRYHQSMFLKIDDFVYLRLQKKYNILTNLKIIKKLF